MVSLLDLSGFTVLLAAWRTCQTGLLLPKWTPTRAGLLGHFLDFESPAELLLEQGALFTFRVTGAPVENLGLLTEFPEDLLREKGHILMLSSAAVPPPPTLLSFFFTFSSVLLLFFFMKMFFHRLDVVVVVMVKPLSVMAGDELGSGTGSGLVWVERR